MNVLNDYLYQGDTVLKILHNYERDLQLSTETIDHIHADYLRGMIDILEHNDFLTSQSQRIRSFYKYMAEKFPTLAFTFKGRIKSLVRAEEKFNRNLIELCEKYYDSNVDYAFPENQKDLERMVKEQIFDIRDLIAYRIIVSMPKCHVKDGADRTAMELDALYEVANTLPAFLKELHFVPEEMNFALEHPSMRIHDDVNVYYKDLIAYPTSTGYQSLHISFLDELANCRFEIQLRTKDMDDFAEIGFAQHDKYEETQLKESTNRIIPAGVTSFYDEAYIRLELLQNLDLSQVDVNMFTAVNNQLMNDGCGFFRGRLILPYEHLSRFQNDLIE